MAPRGKGQVIMIPMMVVRKIASEFGWILARLGCARWLWVLVLKCE